MASIPLALAHVKQQYQDLLSAALIHSICTSLGHVWRNRLLNPATTVHLFLLQVLAGNVAVNHLRRLGHLQASDTAYGNARARLPVELLRTLLALTAAQAAPAHLKQRGDDPHRFHGLRVHLIDGSHASMPDTPELQQHFGQPAGQAPGCGFPVAHLLYLLDYATGLVLSLVLSPLYTHDLAQAPKVHHRLGPGDLLLGDRAFCSFAHLALLQQRGVHGVFRLHQRVQLADRHHPHRALRRRRALAWPRGPIRDDFLADWRKPVQRPAWMTAADYQNLPDRLRVRILHYRVTRPGFRTRQVTLGTTLTDPRTYPARELAELYQVRWTIEQHFRELKTLLGMQTLRCRTVEGVTKELLVYALVYNLVRLVMLQAARRQAVDVARVSFVDAARWLLYAGDDQPLPDLIVNPHRPGRVQPRAVKRRPKEYPRLTRPRRAWIDLLLAGADDA
jgi:hypothetical protein